MSREQAREIFEVEVKPAVVHVESIHISRNGNSDYCLRNHIVLKPSRRWGGTWSPSCSKILSSPPSQVESARRPASLARWAIQRGTAPDDLEDPSRIKENFEIRPFLKTPCGRFGRNVRRGSGSMQSERMAFRFIPREKRR